MYDFFKRFESKFGENLLPLSRFSWLFLASFANKYIQ